MITSVKHEQLFNTGNYENVKFGAEAKIEDGDINAAWAEAKAQVDTQWAAFQGERKKERQRSDLQYDEQRLRNAISGLRSVERDMIGRLKQIDQILKANGVEHGVDPYYLEPVKLASESEPDDGLGDDDDEDDDAYEQHE